MASVGACCWAYVYGVNRLASFGGQTDDSMMIVDDGVGFTGSTRQMSLDPVTVLAQCKSTVVVAMVVFFPVEPHSGGSSGYSYGVKLVASPCLHPLLPDPSSSVSSGAAARLRRRRGGPSRRTARSSFPGSRPEQAWVALLEHANAHARPPTNGNPSASRARLSLNGLSERVQLEVWVFRGSGWLTGRPKKTTQT